MNFNVYRIIIYYISIIALFLSNSVVLFVFVEVNSLFLLPLLGVGRILYFIAQRIGTILLLNGIYFEIEYLTIFGFFIKLGIFPFRI